VNRRIPEGFQENTFSIDEASALARRSFFLFGERLLKIEEKKFRISPQMAVGEPY
jgi:hypothetical protein